jgi:cysteine desulfurase
MLPFLREHFGNPSSGHPYGAVARGAVEKARRQVAAFLGARPEEIVFTSGESSSTPMPQSRSARSRWTSAGWGWTS